MPGPAPKPTSLKQLIAPERFPENVAQQEPQPVQELFPAMPRWLEPSDEDRTWLQAKASEIWNELSQELTTLRLLTRIDKIAFARYCFTLATYITLKRWVEQHGTTYPVYEEVALTDDKGIPMFRADGLPITQRRLKKMATFPQYDQMLRASTELRSLEHEFGLTPSARVRLRGLSEGSIGNEPRPRAAARSFNYRTRKPK